MAENQFFIDSDKLSEAALERKHKLETDPSSRTNHMEYMPGMEQIDPTIRNKVLSEMDSYDYNKYTARDVQNALEHETCSVEDFKALLSPAAEPFLEHVLTLLFIYYFKNLLSINDIQSLLNPLTEHYFGNKAGFNMEDVYNEVFNLESTESEKLLKDLGKKYALSRETFRKFPENDQEFLQNFSFICLLSYDVYIKKMIIESVIDNINSQNSKTNKKENSKKESSKKDTI